MIVVKICMMLLRDRSWIGGSLLCCWEPYDVTICYGVVATLHSLVRSFLGNNLQRTVLVIIVVVIVVICISIQLFDFWSIFDLTNTPIS